MKHLLLVVLLFITRLSYSQTRFAGPGAYWCTSTFIPFNGSITNPPLYSIDTNILGIPCSYISGTGCLFVQNDTVYRIKRDSSIHFMYDYSAHKGDRWKINSSNDGMPSGSGGVPVRIDSVYTVVAWGRILRMFNTSVVDTPYTNHGYTLGRILEGVGGEYTFLPGLWGGVYDVDVPRLSCYSDSAVGDLGIGENDVIIKDSCVCRYSTGFTQLIRPTYLSIVPNPAANFVTISIDEILIGNNLIITDLTGRTLIQTKLTSANTQLSTEEFSAGLYLVTVNSGEYQYSQKLVIEK